MALREILAAMKTNPVGVAFSLDDRGPAKAGLPQKAAKTAIKLHWKHPTLPRRGFII